MNNDDPPAPHAEDADDDEPVAAEAGVVPEGHRIESLEQWLEWNGLRAPPDADDDGDDDDRWETVRDRERVTRARDYAASVHARVFEGVDRRAAVSRQHRERTLRSWRGRRLTLVVGGGDDDEDTTNTTTTTTTRLADLDLVPLAEACDLIFALASTWHHYNPGKTEDTHENEDDDDGDDDARDEASLVLNLPDHSPEAVRAFVDIIHQKQSLSDWSDDGGMIVDLCHLAHYLQNGRILEDTVDILLRSIDTANCLAMTELADQLHLPRLFEASLQHMMQSVHNLEDGECWDDLTPELRRRIEAIRTAIQSSIHDQRSVLYFASLQEYLAIFAERVHYYKERLAQAVEQQIDRPRSAAWWDTQRKIERQRQRLHTLQVAFEEQKKLFGRSHSST